MIINSITLKNFRSYEDETTFSFAPKDDKNIVLVGGENGAGKSTLFEAIKLCIYGPITYGYLGENHNYLTKIKNNINNNAFTNENIDCYLAISISFKEGTEIKDYYLKRSWSYVNQRIHEDFKIYLNDKELNNEDKLYFDKYLKSVLPPSLFDFFFFDGEELSDFFTGKSASSNLKESILELFNYDTFEVLKKQLLSYQRSKSKSNIKLDEAQKNFDDLSSTVKEIKMHIEDLQNTLVLDEEQLDNLLIKREESEEDFKNSGGLLEGEKAALNSEISKLENDRININTEIKDFCNDTLPFLLVIDLLKDTKEQTEKEEALNSYNAISKKLSGDVVKNALNTHLPQNINKIDYDGIAVDLLNAMFNKNELEEIDNILELSTEQKNTVNHTIDNILGNQEKLKKLIFNRFNKISEITIKIKNLREKLNSSISDDILNNYLETLHSINTEINTVEKNIALKKASIEHKQNELKNKEYHLTRARNEYTTLLQNINVLDMSNQLIEYLEELLSNLTKDKIKLIEDEFIKIFSMIIRKDNYVNSIVIDDNFNTTLYINKDYTSNELLNVIKNLGFDELVKKYGAKFLEDLLNHYEVMTIDQLKDKVFNDVWSKNITLSTKININDFSNGEKQIYILCLIWAIIKSSGVEIPFIIDTPYARIDETHRNSLTTTYLPNISKQVIILSTNKEIDHELYKVVKPYVCDEYLLLYNTELRKTEVKNGYFEV
ncbi:DNA sulfur modification protein DndD [Clostridium neonatale]|uniref:Nuclease SbcCD subunit C n=1 Tax=Clostridium neonatale TaxID=137838 RepID=A0A2A7MJE6_9CLOT|nr:MULTISPECIES: DNA sulfur modification protein DndD [Clostridium]MDU4846725.1 DNA sulfur modification protein DndD [Clostridium sp.]PEG27560.1 DNA sulfur modification protein DndD [Clostridium neonatale]PEG31268.1 DNA sulfur modification protein DndD [Clostridium neonatale]CAH0437298.1 DNA sulfur modification protein [Clostridium neonatale]